MGDGNVSLEAWMVTSPVNDTPLFADITTLSTDNSTLTAGITTLSAGNSTFTVDVTTSKLLTTSRKQIMFDSTTISGDDFTTSETYDYNYSYYEYDEYMFPGYSFERPVYLFVWEILVIFTFLVNIIVISVLLRRKMRNVTNMILAAIAISDSLTGLVTLPTYIMVYQRYDPRPVYDDYPANYSNPDYYQDSNGDYSNDSNPLLGDVNLQSNIETANISTSTYQYPDATAQASVDGYKLTKSLCVGFIISKYFLSKSFHTVSIFLTLFLGFQRYVCVAFPFKSQKWFGFKKTIMTCAVIFLLSPVLHSYHLVSEKASDTMCQWELEDGGCGGGCIYLWVAFFVRHLIPCTMLLIFTVLFIKQLKKGERNLRRMDSNASQLTRRVEENRRISVIVTAIVIVFLVPEIPYGVYLLYNAIEKTVNNGKDIHLETNRAIHMSYEILLVLSFHANFYIYTLFNRRFRKCLYRTFIKPIQGYVGDVRRLSVVSRTSSASQRRSRKTNVSSKTLKELHGVHGGNTGKTATLETKFMEPFSVDITHSSCSDKHEIEALNTKV